ncbi:MAG: SigE family RNA polymerase sigma factor [Mycobacteriales bacterium]
MAKADWQADYVAYFHARAHHLRRTAYLLCNDWHVAEDLVQATFLRLYPRWRRIRPATADAYARRVLFNLYLSSRRSRPAETVTDSPPDRPAPEGRDSDARLDIAGVLATLPARQRAMVVLRYLEDLPIAEVSALLGVAEGTVKSQTARGLQALRDALGAPASQER